VAQYSYQISLIHFAALKAKHAVKQAGMTSPCYAQHAKNAYKAAMNSCHWHYYLNIFKDEYYYVENCNTSFLTLTAGLNNMYSNVQVIFFS